MTEHIEQSPEVVETIFRRDLVPALDAHRLPIESVWSTAHSTENGLQFTTPAQDELPAIRLNATKEALNFSINGEGPFRVAAGAIQKVIDERKRPE